MGRGIGGTGRPEGRHESSRDSHRRRNAARRTAEKDRQHPPHDRKEAEKEQQVGRRIPDGSVQ
jgi:hypothetical protein